MAPLVTLLVLLPAPPPLTPRELLLTPVLLPPCSSTSLNLPHPQVCGPIAVPSFGVHTRTVKINIKRSIRVSRSRRTSTRLSKVSVVCVSSGPLLLVRSRVGDSHAAAWETRVPGVASAVFAYTLTSEWHPRMTRHTPVLFLSLMRQPTRQTPRRNGSRQKRRRLVSLPKAKRSAGGWRRPRLQRGVDCVPGFVGAV